MVPSAEQWGHREVISRGLGHGSYLFCMRDSTFSYTTSMMADCGMTRSSAGPSPLKKPATPSLLAVSLTTSQEELYLSKRLASCRCCSRDLITCGTVVLTGQKTPKFSPPG